MTKKTKKQGVASGRLRIGDDWNAITIIALSQSNPLKAVAEFVENSIDAHAKHIVIVRGKEQGEPYLSITDDGEGIPRDETGVPNFRYVATHIGDSLKRRLKQQGSTGIQGEFGIGLLSFWTVGEELTLTSSGADGRVYQMRMRKGDPGYAVTGRNALLSRPGTELKIKPLLAGIRQMSGEKIQWYLASELRDRIRQSGVELRVVDRHARREYRVEPRRFSGRLLHDLPAGSTPLGEAYLELYLAEPAQGNQIGLYRSGTRVLASISELDVLQRAPWTSGFLEGIVDAPFLNLTPGTRSGVIQDQAFEALLDVLAPVETRLIQILDEQRRAEEEQTSRHILRAIQRAFQEALLALPAEQYDWFDVRGRGGAHTVALGAEGAPLDESKLREGEDEPAQKQFFGYAGPLFSVRVSPTSCVVPVNGMRTLRAVARDRSRRTVEEGVVFSWTIAGGGRLENADGEIVTFHASAEPGLTALRVIAFERAPGELWRSRYDAEQNVIVINNGHRDFVYASRSSTMKLRYIARLFAKELVIRNFPGQPAGDLLERMVELSLYTEEHLR